jgi:hypothetical protein
MTLALTMNEMTSAKMKTGEMTVTHVDVDDDDDWDESTTFKGPIGNPVYSHCNLRSDPPAEEEPESTPLAEEKPKSTPVSSVKTDAAKLLRQNWATFVRKICSDRPPKFIVKADDAHSAKWAVKTLTSSEYFFWMLAFRAYKKNNSLVFEQKKGLRAVVDHKRARELNEFFGSLFPGCSFWSSKKDQNEYKWEEYFRNFSE